MRIAAMPKEELGPLLKELRVDAGLSEAQMAVHTDVTVKTIQNWEHGVTKPRLDLAARTLTVVEKGGHERRLPITNDVLRALDFYLFELPATSGPLLRSARNGYEPIQAASIGKLVADWMRAAGVKRRPYDGVSAHALRRTALTEVAQATGDPFVLQQLAGWA